MGKVEAIICDIDGTLAHMNGRRSPYNWKAVGQDDVDEVVASILEHYNTVILVSGRDEVCRPETVKWLEDNSIHYEILLMREIGDNRKDTIIKEEIYLKRIEPFYKIEFVLDDRDQVVKMWRSHGLKCLQVAEGDF